MHSEQAVNSIDVVWNWLEQKRNILLVGHERPDGDSFASVLAMFLALRDWGKRVEAFFSCEEFPYRYHPIYKRIEDQTGICLGGVPALSRNFDGLLCLDTSTWARVDLPDGVNRKRPRMEVCNIDHHGDNQRFAKVNWVEADYAATAQMVFDLLKYRQIPISGLAAELLLTGLITDTGGFRFQNTNAATFRAAASLLERDAQYGVLIDSLFFNEPYNKLLLKNKLLENGRFEFDGRLLWSVLDSSLLHKFNVKAADTEDCIEALRGVAGVEVACLIQPDDESVRFSLRSRRMPYNVAEIARRLGGGGHLFAAGIKLPETDLEEAKTRFFNTARTWFKNDGP